MIDENGKGRRWARVLSTVLFGIETLALLVLLLAAIGSVSGRGSDPAGILAIFVYVLLEWAAGLGAIICTFSRGSALFYQLDQIYQLDQKGGIRGH